MGVALTIQHDLLPVAPNVSGIKIMGLSLTVQSVKPIKSLIHWVSFRTGSTESPFAEHTGNVTGLFQDLRNRNRFQW